MRDQSEQGTVKVLDGRDIVIVHLEVDTYFSIDLEANSISSFNLQVWREGSQPSYVCDSSLFRGNVGQTVMTNSGRLSGECIKEVHFVTDYETCESLCFQNDENEGDDQYDCVFFQFGRNEGDDLYECSLISDTLQCSDYEEDENYEVYSFQCRRAGKQSSENVCLYCQKKLHIEVMVE